MFRVLSRWIRGGTGEHPVLDGPWGLPLLLALAVVLNLDLLDEGLFLDDYLVLTSLQGETRFTGHPSSVFELFNFGTGDPAVFEARLEAGTSPWWVDPTYKQRLCRPLAGLTHRLDLALFGLDPVAMHAHGILWFALATLGAWCAYLGLFRSRRQAFFATLGFVLSPQAVQAVGWVVSRNTLMALAFGAFAFAGHLRGRATGSRGWALGAAGLLALGLASGEGASAAAALILVHAATLDDGGRGERLEALAPPLVVVAAWLVAYRAYGFGAGGGSGLYLDPLALEPGSLLELGRRFWLYASVILGTGLSADLYAVAGSGLATVIAAHGALAALLTLVLLAPALVRDRGIRFWTLAGLAVAIPPSLGWPTDRVLGLGLLVTPGLAVRLLLVYGGAGLDTLGLRVLGGLLATRLFLVHPFLRPVYWTPFKVLAGMLGRASTEGVLAADGLAGRTLVLVNPPGAFLNLYLPSIRILRGLRPPLRTRMLLPGMWPTRIYRPGPASLEVEIEGGLHECPFANAFRRPGDLLPPGTEVDLGDVTYRVDAVAPDGSPRRITATFPHPLEDPRLAWVEWSGGVPVRFELPAVGGSRSLAPSFSHGLYLGLE